jgi:hypothetical protein
LTETAQESNSLGGLGKVDINLLNLFAPLGLTAVCPSAPELGRISGSAIGQWYLLCYWFTASSEDEELESSYDPSGGTRVWRRSQSSESDGICTECSNTRCGDGALHSAAWGNLLDDEPDFVCLLL